MKEVKTVNLYGTDVELRTEFDNIMVVASPKVLIDHLETIANSTTEQSINAYVLPITEGIKTYVNNYMTFPFEIEKDMTKWLNKIFSKSYKKQYENSIFENDKRIVFNLAIINVRTLLEIIDALKLNEKNISIFIVKPHYQFLKKTLLHFQNKYSFSKELLFCER